MSDFPPPPAGSKIRIEASGDRLRAVIPGRWTTAFWLALLACVLWTAVAFGLALGFDRADARQLATPPPIKIAVRFMPWWGVLCFFWFFFVLKARRETVTFDPDFLETRSSFVFLAPKKMKSAEIREFVLKPIGLEQFLQAPLHIYGFARRKLLFAAGPRDLALAIQGEDAEFEWLRGVLEAHHRKLHPAAGVSG